MRRRKNQKSGRVREAESEIIDEEKRTEEDEEVKSMRIRL